MRKSDVSIWVFVGALWLATGGIGRAAEVDRLIPGDAEMVVCINVNQFLDSALVQKYALEQIKGSLNKLYALLSDDQKKEADNVVLPMVGMGGPWGRGN